ncbi:MAG: T9SS type A sorting domain-containing protein [Bacteroidota bacterium]|nr:T9SS type A sorting domain-containing protein [Bacteroidota bacterium]
MKRLIFIYLILLFCFTYGYSQNIYDIANNNGKIININNSKENCKVNFTSNFSKVDNQNGYYNYTDGENYKITFNAGKGKRVNFTFTSDVGVYIDDNGNLKNYGNDYYIYPGDTIYFYDGPSTSSPLIHKYTGISEGVYDKYNNIIYGIGMSNPINSSDSCMTIAFKSNSDGHTSAGWAADVICQDIPPLPQGCNGNISASNFITNSPNMCNLKGYCGNTSDYYTADIPQGMCEMCNLFNGSIQNNSWMTFIADSSNVSLSVKIENCTLKQGIQIGVYSIINNNYVLLSDIGYTSGDPSYNNANKILNLNIPYKNTTKLSKGQTYYVMVDGLGGDVCDYTITGKSGISFQSSAGPDQTICSGELTTLNASGGKTYTWSPSNGLSNPFSKNPTAKPTTTTTYRLSMTDAGINTDCPFKAVDSIVVKVNPSPLINIGADTSLCSGDSLKLIVSAAQGSTYTWDNGGGSASSITISPIKTTTYKITVKNNGCSFLDSIKITINPNPTLAYKNISIYSGNQANIIPTNITDAESFLWSNGDTSSSITTNPTTTTTYTLTATSAYGCTNTAGITVTVKPKKDIIISADSTIICSGASLTLTASGATTYSWNTGGETASITVIPTTTTKYKVTGISEDGTSTGSVTVTVIPSPNTNAGADQTITKGNKATLTASGATTYLWCTTSTKASITVFPSITTTYTVTGSSNNGCTAEDKVIIYISEVGVEEISNTNYELLIYPNPSDEIITIERLNKINSEKGLISIYNVIGEVFFASSVTNDKIVVDIKKFPNGIYYIEYKNGETVEFRKFIKN